MLRKDLPRAMIPKQRARKLLQVLGVRAQNDHASQCQAGMDIQKWGAITCTKTELGLKPLAGILLGPEALAAHELL